MTGDIKDLMLSGVNWELNENSNTNNSNSVSMDKNSDAKFMKNNSATDTSYSRPGPAMPGLSNIVSPVEPVDTSAAVRQAADIAAAAADWNGLVQAIREYNHSLKVTAKNTILPEFGGASFIVIVDSPSADDEACGKILSGAAGELFEKMIGAIGAARENITIIPLTFWRAPGGRTPTRDEMDLCRPFVMRAIELSGAKNILTLGTVAAAEVSGASLPKQHGEDLTAAQIGFSDLAVIPIFHPNYVLLKPDAKRPVWDALQKLLQIVNNVV